MKAVILAAGRGNRFKGSSNEPKPLYIIGEKSLLEHSLDALTKAGIKEIMIAIGYNGYKIKDKIGNKFNEANIQYAINDSWEKSSSMHSLYTALNTHPEDCLVLDGDILYHSQGIVELLNFNKKDSFLLSEITGSGDEVYVLLNNGKIEDLGKEIKSQQKLFESTGISKLSKGFLSKMFELHKLNLEKDYFGEHYEYCALRTSKIIPLYGYIKKDMAWSEVDKPEDIQRLEETFLRIKNSEN